VVRWWKEVVGEEIVVGGKEKGGSDAELSTSTASVRERSYPTCLFLSEKK